MTVQNLNRVSAITLEKQPKEWVGQQRPRVFILYTFGIDLFYLYFQEKNRK